MTSYVILDDATDAMLRGGTCLDAEIALQPLHPSESIHAVADGVLGWPDLNLEPQRATAWEAVKDKRNAIIDGGATTPAGAVDSDPLSRSNISGATMGALLAKQAGQAFAIVWTLLDNSIVALDADGMIALGRAVMGHVNAAHDRARQLRAQIDDAETLAALLRLDMDSGWPA